ncbi:MAG: hypothetical protein C5B55_05265 [Blastocatellia bacterium]|nr:MAG: hypothetical protein C5B55_05265 [Blastocatellia bacterium]
MIPPPAKRVVGTRAWNETAVVLRLERMELLTAGQLETNFDNLTISVAVYNIDRCIMSILLQHLLHQ